LGNVAPHSGIRAAAALTAIRRAVALAALKLGDLILELLDFLFQLLDLAAQSLLAVGGTVLALAVVMMVVMLPTDRLLPKALIPRHVGRVTTVDLRIEADLHLTPPACCLRLSLREGNVDGRDDTQDNEFN